MSEPAPLPDNYHYRREVGLNGERVNPDGSTPDLCAVCGVDHAWSMADLSHGIIRLIEHANELRPWAEYPISGDSIARQRAGITGTSLLGSMYWDEEDDD